MGQQTIYNGDTGLDSRNKINSNFGELYSIVPSNEVLLNQTGSVSVVFANKTLVNSIVFKNTVSYTNIKIGTTAGADNIMPETKNSNRLQLKEPTINGIDNYADGTTTIYITIGVGNCDIRIDSILNFI